MPFRGIINHIEQALAKNEIKKPVSLFLRENAWQAMGIGMVVWFLAAVILQDNAASMMIGLLAGIFSFSLQTNRPIALLQKKAQLVEKDLPFALMALSVELNLGIAFEKTLLHVSQQDYAQTSRELLRVHEEITLKGASVQEALQHFAHRVESIDVHRAVSQLVNAYERGGQQNRGEPVRRIAMELLSKQRSESKAFGSKLTVLSLLFVAVSAIVPALFQSFVIVGSLFLSLDWTPWQVLLVIGAGFPLLDIGVLWYIAHQTPVFLRE